MAAEHPDWLPVDWKVCVRVRNYGRKDKYYINPLNGLKFNSKPDVLRYLKNAGTEPTLNELAKIDIEKAAPEEVAPGWIEEIGIKRKGGKTRRDLSTVGAKGQRLTDEKANNILTNGNGTINTPDAPSAKHVEQSETKTDSVATDLPHNLPQVDANRSHQFGTRRNTRSASSKLKNNVTDDQFFRSGSKVAAVEDTNLPEINAVENGEKEEVTVAKDCQHEEVTRENKRKKPNSKSANDLPRRTSRRLAGAEADPSSEVETSKQALAARLQSDEAEIITTENKAKASLSHNPETNNTSEDFGNSCEEKTEVPTKNNKQNEQESVGFDMKEDEKKLDSSLDDLLMDPCIEFAIKTLTGAIPIEDVIKVDESSVSSSLASPHQTSVCDIWTDPCFEFAVKMLTDEIPVGPLSSSGTVGCNNSLMSTHSFGQFDGVMKPYAWQQGVINPSLPRTATDSGGCSSQSIEGLKGKRL